MPREGVTRALVCCRQKTHLDKSHKSERAARNLDPIVAGSSTMLAESSTGILKSKKSFWKSISGIFKAKSKKRGKKKAGEEHRGAESDNVKCKEKRDDVSSSEEEQVGSKVTVDSGA